MDTHDPLYLRAAIVASGRPVDAPNKLEIELGSAQHGERWDVPSGWNGSTLDGGSYSIPTHLDVDIDNYPNF